jgi:hypothetical protein
VGRFRHRLGLLVVLLAVSISVTPLLTPVSAEVSADGWAPQESGTLLTLYGVSGTSPSDVLACGDAGVILRYNGGAWVSMNSGVTVPLYGIWCSSTGAAFAVGNAGTISKYDGISWNQMASGTSNHLNAVWGAAADDVFAVGNVGSILHYDGISWSPMASGTTSHLRGIWGSSSTDVFTVGNGGVILHYDGISWVTMDSGTKAKLYSVWGAAPNDIVAVGEAGIIVRHDGTSWAGVGSGTTASLNGVWGLSADDIFAAGGNGLILHYDGAWSSMSSGTTSILYGVWGASSFNVYAVGAGGTILHYVENAESPPVIGSVEPSQACQGATLTVTISGTDLSGATTVDFASGVTVTSFQVNPDGTQITADITIDAAATPGSRDISVTTPAGTDTLSGAFTVQLPPPVPPVLTSVAPISGVCGQTLVAIISGTDLSGATTVDFASGVTVTSFQVNPDGTQITADITIDATASPGTRDVSVTTPAGSDTLCDAFTVLIPFSYVVETSPRSGMIGETLDIVISGENLDGVIAVDFGPGIEVNSFTLESADRMSVRITVRQDAKAGYRDVSIVTLWSTYTQLEGFSVKAVPPSLGSISDIDGRPGEVMTVTIEGTNLVGVTRVSFGPGIEVQGFDMYPPDSLRVRISVAEDAEPGMRDVSVTTAPGGTCIFEDAFEITGPATNTPPWAPIGAATGALMAGTLLLVFRGVTTLRGLRSS